MSESLKELRDEIRRLTDTFNVTRMSTASITRVEDLQEELHNERDVRTAQIAEIHQWKVQMDTAMTVLKVVGGVLTTLLAMGYGIAVFLLNHFKILEPHL